MSCSNDNCVCEVVREIADIQDEVAGNNNGCCTTSCERSIQQLLSPATNGNNTAYSTIPFVLTCKGDCGVYFGAGVYSQGMGSSRTFTPVFSPIFRVKEFLNDGDCCARLELLLPYSGSAPVTGTEGDISSFFSGTVNNFIATGVCITVDLSCFCAISCLDPITPVPASQFPA